MQTPLLLKIGVAALALVGAGWLAFDQLHGESAESPFTKPLKPTGFPARIAYKVDLYLASTLAGGKQGNDDGPAATARFSDPYGLAQDKDGNLYVSDGGDNNSIRKIARDGTVSTLAGGREGFADGLGAAAEFNTPSGMVIDRHGNLYVADTGNHAVHKISPDGRVTTLAGSGQPGWKDGMGKAAQFNGPIGLALDGAGNLVVADTYNDRIRLVTTEGKVTTLAGGSRAGFADGQGSAAQFDTPCAVVVDAQGDILVADTKNSAIRTLARDGNVSTIFRTPPEQHMALLRRPSSLALAPNGSLYIGDMRGQVVRLASNGELTALDDASAASTGKEESNPLSGKLRLARPSALLLEADGSLLAVEGDAYRVSKVVTADKSVPAKLAATSLPALPALTGVKEGRFAWPVKPQYSPHEIVGLLGEVRGNYDGEARDHIHAGLDVQAAMGAPVLAVADEKITDPLSTWSFGKLGEGLSLAHLSYIHMKVGRTGNDKAIDPDRFLIQRDEHGKPEDVRVRRGTRFKLGDQLGSVNRMYHVHLALAAGGRSLNPLALPLAGYRDTVAPTIEHIEVVDADGDPYEKKRGGRLLLPAGEEFGIVVAAYDQMDGNQKRRRLWLYRVGYQILDAQGKPLPGYEQPMLNLEFNSLPRDRDAVKIAYADHSGITVYGSDATRMLYTATNRVRDGMAETGYWSSKGLAPGDYTIRIYAADYAGNVAQRGRDLAVTLTN